MNFQAVLVSRRDAASALGVSLRTVEYLIQRGELPIRRVGKRTLIPAAIHRFAKADHPGPVAPQGAQ
jgi:excisionase family DNA binding protein